MYINIQLHTYRYRWESVVYFKYLKTQCVTVLTPFKKNREYIHNCKDKGFESLKKTCVLKTQMVCLKGQSNEIFDSQFFSSLEPAWATDQWVKIFLNLVSFLPRYSYFSIEKTDSPGYHTPGVKTKIHPISFLQR